CIEWLTNPAHKRSDLARLLPAGRVRLAEESRQEAAFIQGVAGIISEAEARSASAVLRRVGQPHGASGSPVTRAPTRPAGRRSQRRASGPAPAPEREPSPAPPAALPTESAPDELPVSLL